MRNPVIFLTSVALAILCLLALDDITTGSEPSHLLEWTIVAVTVFWFGGLFWRRQHGS